MIMAGSVNPRWFRAPATNFIDVRPGDMGDSLVPNGLSIVCNVFLLQVDKSQVVVHKADQPDAVVDFLDACPTRRHSPL